MNRIEKLARQKNSIICRYPGYQQHVLLHSPQEIISCYKQGDIANSINKLEEYKKQGLTLSGFISYEAAASFNKNFVTHEINDFPLLWFAIYKNKPQPINFKDFSNIQKQNSLEFTPELSQKEYLELVDRVKELIIAGDIYQANITFRAYAKKVDDPLSLFIYLNLCHPVPCSAYINMGDINILSISPELFFKTEDNHITSLPMKGTAKREKWYQPDKLAANKLQQDEKNRAENIMIVDMMRNDFGRMCEIGSINVDPLFRVDSYKTVHQMVSGINGKVDKDISIKTILSSIFPPSSITGTPKVRAMQIIKEIEKSPRKIYTGTIGCINNLGDYVFNVAIRTLICSKDKTELGIGSGIIFDSDPKQEWQECLLKSSFTKAANEEEFFILETMLWEEISGIANRQEHLTRAYESQMYFHRKWNESSIMQALENINTNYQQAKVRLLIDADGAAKASVSEIINTGWGKPKIKVLLSKNKIDSNNIFYYHKTTNRDFYNQELLQAKQNGFDEVIFTNENNQITEGSISNIFIYINNKWITPPLYCGLLNGIWRAEMIKTYKAQEQPLSIEDIKNADKVILGNSIRGTCLAEVVC